MRSGQGSVGDFMGLVLALKSDPSASVMESVVQKVRTIDARIASDEDSERLASVIRREFGPVYQSLGAPTKGESFDKEQLRANLFTLLGYANDPAVLAQARDLTERSFASGAKKDKTLDPLLADAAVLIAVAHGDSALYDRVLAASKDTSNPDDQSDALITLARFRDPALVTRTLDYTVSGEVRNQDSWILMSLLLSQRETRDQAWQYIEQNWDKVHAQFTTNSGGRVVAATGSFCSVEKRDEVASFFSTHKVDASERTLSKSIDSINACVQLRADQEPKLRRWLDLQTTQAKQ
jgi:aminopeptidase N